MKLTKSKNSKNAEFFRNTEKGMLVIDKKEEQTSNVINDLPHDTSFVGRILRKPTHPKAKTGNDFFKFVESLVDENININTQFIPKPSEKEDFVLLLNKSLSAYGKNLKYNKKSKTLEELLLLNYEKKDVISELNQLKDHISKLISQKKNSLIKSVEKNIVPFKIENCKLSPSSGKMIWLFSFLENNGSGVSLNQNIENSYDEFNKVYEYSKLENQIRDKINSFSDEENLTLFQMKEIYQIVLDYNHIFFEENKSLEYGKNIIDKNYSFFIIEMRDHFRKHYPVKKKENNQKKGIPGMTVQKAGYYCSEKFVRREVKKCIVNQLVAGLIQYGKIQYYYLNDSLSHHKNTITSKHFSNIQIEEAFKKQMFLSISCAITKLNYFYNYGSQNENTLGTSNLQGDILFDNNYKRDFSTNLNNESKKELRAKISTCFPIEISDKIDVIKELLKEIVSSIEDFRNNIFHFNKDTLTNILKEFENKYVESPEFLKRDIKNIKVNFKEYIRSMNLTEYYSENLLVKLFSENDLKFHLYAPHYAMTPSFKNIYKRGCNIYKSDRSEKGIHWLIELGSEIDTEGQLAYKNLLQLIYYNSFLPAICEKDGLITAHINKTIEWNQNESRVTQKGKHNMHKFRYADMPKYDSSTTTLKSYLENLQRQQSQKENEEIDPNKSNYYLDFVQDIFVLAFDAYLNKILPLYKTEILKPKKIIDENGISISKLALDKLFSDGEPILKMETNLKNTIEFICAYPFLRVLDQRELNKLLHQLIRYRTSSEARNIDNIEVILNLKKFEELITLIQFTIPLQIADKHFEYAMDRYFKDFFENKNPKDFEEMYYQSDKETLVSHRSMSIIGRSGAMALYKEIFSFQYQIKKSDYENYKEYFLPQEVTLKPKIETKQKELQELHQELVKIKVEKNRKPNDMALSPAQFKKVLDYKLLAEEIRNYECLRHKITFESLYKLHQIHVDILARFAAFAEDWERDMFFMLTALKKMEKIDFDVNEVFEGGSIVGKLGKALKGNDEKLFFELCWSNEEYSPNMGKVENRLFIRNSIGHLNHMTQLKRNNKFSQPSIIEMINRLRTLLSYDIKRQNSVTKALQDLLKKQYKVKLTFSPVKLSQNNNQYTQVEFELKNIKSCDIIHLKNLAEPLQIPANDEFMIKLIQQLLEFKY